MNGILIIAHRDERYIRMAANLACSIKLRNKAMPVCLLTDRSTFQGFACPVNCFDHVRFLSQKDDVPFFSKTRAYDYTPFEQTIMIDADSYCINDPDTIFDDDLENEFDTHVVDRFHHSDRQQCTMLWADLSALWQYYRLGQGATFSETNSSYIRWKQGPKAKAIFALAEYLYAAHPYSDWNSNRFHRYPDELAWNSALALAGVTPSKGSPVYFSYYKSGPPDINQIEQHVFFSLMGAGNTHGHLWRHYQTRMHREFVRAFKWYGFNVGRSDKQKLHSVRIVHKPWMEHSEENFRNLINATK